MSFLIVFKITDFFLNDNPPFPTQFPIFAKYIEFQGAPT